MELKQLIEGIHANYLARGNRKIIHNEEKEIINWARESVVTTKKILKGERLTRNNIATKRPTPRKSQIPANKYFIVLGKKAKKNLIPNTIIKFRDIK